MSEESAIRAAKDAAMHHNGELAVDGAGRGTIEAAVAAYKAAIAPSRVFAVWAGRGQTAHLVAIHSDAGNAQHHAALVNGDYEEWSVQDEKHPS